MTPVFKSAVVALSLVAAGLSVSAPTASAAGLEYRFGGGDSSLIIRDNRGPDYGPRDDWRRGDDYRRDDRRHDDWRRYGQRRDRGYCDPDLAVAKARAMGLHRARVIDAGRRYVSVGGINRGNRVQVTFGNVWSCPVAYR